jgi:hypothetical protein
MSNTSDQLWGHLTGHGLERATAVVVELTSRLVLDRGGLFAEEQLNALATASCGRFNL